VEILPIFWLYSRPAFAKIIFNTLLGKDILQSGVLCTNVLQAAFANKDPIKAQKDTNDLTVFLRFWDLCS